MFKLNQKSHFIAIILIIMLGLQTACKEKVPTDLTKESIIPKPVSIIASGESFYLKSRTRIFIQGESDELFQIGKYLADRLKPATGFKMEVLTSYKAPRAGNIYLTLLEPDASLGDEGYKLTIARKFIKLAANSPAGLFRGVQTIRQILPADIEMSAKQDRQWEIATGIITDYPDYSYRGAMLDVSRHFFGVDDVKRFIDFLACYKMNMLHLHLSDDQGWRIEIKSWPNLALHGGSTQVGGESGGYYTQEEYRDLIDYASEQYITIIPEIDMPGHTNAALSSYAELNCDGKATELYTGTRVGFSTLCTDKEVTYTFIDDVIRELAALTPGPYIHIGGDESHATKEEDYIPFVNTVQDIVLAHNKQVIGWDDIAITSVKPNAFIQDWASEENAKMGVSKGAKIIMSPAKKAYLDMKYDRSTKLGLRWAGLIEVDTAYIWDPATYIPGVGKEHILGIEAALWTETITNMDEIEYMVFPRLPGYAEIGWTPTSLRDWDDYKERLGNHGARFQAMDINFYQSPLVQWSGIAP
jgi:hexosaminidase